MIVGLRHVARAQGVLGVHQRLKGGVNALHLGHQSQTTAAWIHSGTAWNFP